MAEGQVSISQRGAERLRSGHLWVYRSDVRSAEAESGDIVRVKDERGNFVGRAFFSSRSQITVRLLTREDAPVDRDFFKARIQAAAEYRKRVVEDTEAFRLVYSEADLLPSLIVDRYADWLVLQTLSQGSERHKEEFVSILTELFSPRGILERNDDGAFQPRLRRQPFMHQPLVHRVADRGAELPVLVRLPVVAGGIEDAEDTVVGVQQLLLHERQGASGTAAARRPRIAAGGVGLALRIGGTCLICLARARAEGAHMLDPALLQIGVQRLVAAALRMDVAIRCRELGTLRLLRCRAG